MEGPPKEGASTAPDASLKKKPRIQLRESAESDVIEITGYYEERSRRVAERFVSAFQKAVERIAEHPEIGRPRKARSSHLAGLRSWPVPGFEVTLVFYMPLPGVIDVLRVLHGARDLAMMLGLDED